MSDITKFESVEEINKKGSTYSIPGYKPNATLVDMICYHMQQVKGGAKINEVNFGYSDKEIVDHANYMVENGLLFL